MRYRQRKIGQRWSKGWGKNVALSWNRSMISVISVRPFWASVPAGKVGYLLWDPRSLFCECLWLFEHKGNAITWMCWRKPQLSSHASFWDFFFLLTLLYGNQFTPNPLHLFQCYILCVTERAEVGWTSKSWGCSFLTTAVSAGIRLSTISTFLPTQKDQGNKKD